MADGRLAPADLDLRAGQLVQPDLFVVPPIPGRGPARWEECGIPILIAEVVSPSTARFDRITKRRRYQRSGVPVYWVVDLDARLRWHPARAAAALTIDVSAYMNEVWAEHT